MTRKLNLVERRPVKPWVLGSIPRRVARRYLMSSNCRATLSKLRQRYAKAFDIPIEEVEMEEWPDDEGCVYAPKHPELPKWTTGFCP